VFLDATVLVLGSAAVGALLGAVANIAIHRLPRVENVTWFPSSCPSCATRILSQDGAPTVSWLLLTGKCRHCGRRISWRYPAVAAVTAVLFGLVATIHGSTWTLPSLLALTWALVVTTAIDLEHRIIPNKLTYPLFPLLLAWLVGAAAWEDAWSDLRRGVVVGLALPVGMFVLSEVFRLLRGQPGMGMGDVKLGFSLGLVLGYLGPWEVAIGLYATIIASVVVAFVLIAAGRAKLASRIPFGPYLAIGTLVAILGGEPLTGMLRGWLGFAS
jgi:leader peptidase (prepilin peptidase) / N-methyltransferase